MDLLYPLPFCIIMPINHDITYNLDTNTVGVHQLDLPKGYEHLIRLKFIKGGLEGYELDSNAQLTMFFHANRIIDEVNPDFQLSPSDWVWNATLNVYEALFDATVRPLSILGVGSFFTKIRLNDDGLKESSLFTSKFLRASLPQGVSHCVPNDKFSAIPPWFRNWVSEYFKWEMIPGNPIFQLSTLLNTQSGSISIREIPLPSLITNGSDKISLGTSNGVYLLCYPTQESGTNEIVEISRQINSDGTLTMLKAPVNDGTHNLTIVELVP